MALYPVARQLQQQRVVLASASPRRREILSNAGFRFEVVPSRFKETLSKAAFAGPQAYAMETAKQKALEVALRMHQDLRTPDMVIGADTVVAIDGLILEKPVDKQDAYAMLSRLSGREHSVFTGVAIVLCRPGEDGLETQVSEFYEETRVMFSELSEELLWEYIDSGEPMDKAGGYGIQAQGGMLVRGVRGDFLNVVGFPLHRFCRALGRPPTRPAAVPKPGGPASARAVEARPPRPGPAPLLGLVDGFRAFQALRRACRLRVWAELRAPRSAAALSVALGASPRAVRALLDTCVHLGLLRRAPQGYSCSGLAGAFLGSADALLGLVLQLGAAAGPQVSPEPRHAHCFARLCAQMVAATFDLSGFRSACYLGGSSAVLARELSRVLPGLRASACGLPEAEEAEEAEDAEDAEEAEEAEEAELPASPGAGGEVEASLPEADLYVLSGLPGPGCGSEARLCRLLRRAAAACAPGGALLLVEAVGRRCGLRRSLDRLARAEAELEAAEARMEAAGAEAAEATEMEATETEATEMEAGMEAAEAEAEMEAGVEAEMEAAARLLRDLGFEHVRAAPEAVGLDLLLATRAAS